jgi:hypothetical protein
MRFLNRLSPVKQLTVIIGFLALFSLLAGMLILPRYFEYIAASEQQDAIGNLKSICIAELKYFQKNKRYTESLDELGFVPDGIYTYYLGRSVMGSASGKAYTLPASVQTYANGTGFKAVAVSNLDEDLDLDVWTVDEKGVVSNVFNDFNKPTLKDYPGELRQIFMKRSGGK